MGACKPTLLRGAKLARSLAVPQLYRHAPPARHDDERRNGDFQLGRQVVGAQPVHDDCGVDCVLHNEERVA